MEYTSGIMSNAGVPESIPGWSLEGNAKGSYGLVSETRLVYFITLCKSISKDFVKK